MLGDVQRRLVHLRRVSIRHPCVAQREVHSDPCSLFPESGTRSFQDLLNRSPLLVAHLEDRAGSPKTGPGEGGDFNLKIDRLLHLRDLRPVEGEKSLTVAIGTSRIDALLEDQIRRAASYLSELEEVRQARAVVANRDCYRRGLDARTFPTRSRPPALNTYDPSYWHGGQRFALVRCRGVELRRCFESGTARFGVSAHEQQGKKCKYFHLRSRKKVGPAAQWLHAATATDQRTRQTPPASRERGLLPQ
jgi:hypothetical protein